nr:hypothetical protein [Klebsiella pneumoniae]UPG26299.1 hypothetical protein J9B21_000265 [Klebsiella pneumoniae]
MTDCRRRCSIKALASTMPFVGLHGQLGQQLDSLPVVANRERLEAEHRLQLDQVLASGLLTLPVLVPAFDADLELVGDQSQQWRERWAHQRQG